MVLEDVEKDLSRIKVKTKKRRPKSRTARKEEATKENPILEIAPAEKKEEEILAPILSKWAKIIIVGGAGLAVAVVALAIFLIINWSRSGTGDIDLQIYSPVEIYRGAPLDVEIDINNSSQNILKEAALTLSSTAGLVNLSAANNENNYNESLGDLGIGSLSKKSYKFLATGDSNSQQHITVALSYMNGGTRFEVKKTADISIKDSAINLKVQEPDKILSGSGFELEVDYENNSNFDFPAVALDVNYPNAFQFMTASLEPTSLNNHWDLGELASGSKGSVKIRGTLNGSSGDTFDLSAAVSVKFGEKSYELMNVPIHLTVAASPISLQIAVNGRSDYTANLGDKLIYTIQYQNKSGIALANVVVTASLRGEMFDFSSLRTNATQNLSTNQISWDASNTSNLRLLDAGGEGAVSFEISLKNQFPIQRLNDKNFTLHIDVAIDSPSVPYYLSASKTEALVSLDTKVNGLTSIAAKAFYRDADSGIVNTGFLPPKVGQATEYTIHWSIVNYSTDADNVTVSAVLAPGVSWTGQTKSNVDSAPVYDSQTGVVSWTIPKIMATKGVIGDPVGAVFQVSAVPNASQIGGYEPLLSETDLKATDDFTNAALLNFAPAVSTNLMYDFTVGPNGGRVIQ